MNGKPTRRVFCLSGLTGLTAAAASVAGARAPLLGQSRSSTHPDVARIDHDRILAAATKRLAEPVTPITSFAAPRSGGDANDFYSEPEDFFPDPASAAKAWVRRATVPGNPVAVNPEAFTAHRDAVYRFGSTVAALTAAFVVTNDPKYAARAAAHLRAWLVTPTTRMKPALDFAQRIPNAAGTLRFEGVIETVPLAEVARAIKFLVRSSKWGAGEPGAGEMAAGDLAAIHAWFAEYARWLNESRAGGLARDQPDQHGSSWLFQCAAYADANVIGFTSDDSALDALRHRFRTVTLRAEINALGVFPHCVATANPYRNALLNLDLLAGACELLTTRFENPWDYELQDGPGLRSAIAFHFPFLLNRSQWPYPADSTHFKDLPGRRAALLLAGRAYRRPEYVDLWQALEPPADTAAGEILRSFPITQPLLWFVRGKV